MSNAALSPMTNGKPVSQQSGSKWTKIAIGLGALAVLVAAYTLLPLQEWISSFQDWVKGFGALGVVIFIVAYAVATFLLVPGAPLTIAGGVIWGLWAFPIIIAAATLGSAMAFLAARYMFHDRVAARMDDFPRFKAVNEAIGEEGWKVVGLLRLSPALPFSLQNWFLGITPVSFIGSTLATFFAIMPGTLLYVWIGSLGGSAGEGGSAIKYVFFAIGIIATIAVTVIVGKKAKAKLEKYRLEDA